METYLVGVWYPKRKPLRSKLMLMMNWWRLLFEFGIRFSYFLPNQFRFPIIILSILEPEDWSQIKIVWGLGFVDPVQIVTQGDDGNLVKCCYIDLGLQLLFSAVQFCSVVHQLQFSLDVLFNCWFRCAVDFSPCRSAKEGEMPPDFNSERCQQELGVWASIIEVLFLGIALPRDTCLHFSVLLNLY